MPDRRPNANVFFPWRKKSARVGVTGALFRVLDRVGPVTRSSPLRRAVQVACLGAFLAAFFYTCWPYSTPFDTTTFSNKEYLKAELFLLIDPLVGVSTALAGRIVNWPTLLWTLGILALCVVVPRAFCGWLCPLGTMIDAFDGLIGRHFRRWHLPENGPKGGWVHIKYYVLVAVLVSALCGVLTSGYVSAIPVLTRGLLFTGGRAQLAIAKGPDQVGTADWTLYLSVALFAAVFVVGVLGRRFWCRYLCPSGALLSVLNRWRVGERKVEDSCINCNKCVEVCPFDAIREDYTTRTADCTYCQTCGGECPVHAIKFVSRLNVIQLKTPGEPQVEARPFSRRGFLAAGLAGGGAAASTMLPIVTEAHAAPPPLRPPGSLMEPEFLDLCIRCGECFKVCPGPVLHPAGLEHGLDAMWTPVAVPEHAGCHQDCNFCTEVCPTGAIQPLNIGAKREFKMGLAAVDTQTCLPWRDDDRREACDLCFHECAQAGYDAIEMRTIELPVDRDELESQGFSGFEIDEMSRVEAPVVNEDKCVGCGICTYRCHTKLVKQDGKLDAVAIPTLPIFGQA